MRFKTKLFTLLAFITILFSSATTLETDSVNIEPFPHTAELIEEFSRDNMLKYMDELGIEFPKLTMGQAIHESGGFTSKLFVENNNLFGMKRAEQRETTAIGVKYKYAVYRNWKDSVRDFYLMQQVILKKHKSKKAYYNYIFKNYAHDKKYRSKLMKYV